MSENDNKTIVRRLSAALNKKDLETIGELIAPDYFNHNFEIRGPEGYKGFCSVLFNAFPDYQDTIEDLIAEGDKVAVRAVGSGTHEGEYSGIPPTGKRVEFAAFNIFRIVNGKIVEEWDLYDTLTFFQQLGAIPPLGEGEE